MSGQFELFLGADRIPVINWINRHGSPVGRNLRFTVPTEAKAKLQANVDQTFRLVRDGESWDFRLVSFTQAGTGTNGVPAIGRVERTGLGQATSSVAHATPRPSTGVGIPKLDGVSEASEKAAKPDFKSLKAKSEASEAYDASPPTEQGLPTSDAIDEEE